MSLMLLAAGTSDRFANAAAVELLLPEDRTLDFLQEVNSGFVVWVSAGV